MLKSKRRRCRLIEERQPIKGAFVQGWLGEAADKWPWDPAARQLRDGTLTADFIRALRTCVRMNLSFNWAGPGNRTESANSSEKGWNEPRGQIGKFNALVIFDMYVLFVCIYHLSWKPSEVKIHMQHRSHQENFCLDVVESENFASTRDPQRQHLCTNRLSQPSVLSINLAFLFALIPSFPAYLTDNKVFKANSAIVWSISVYNSVVFPLV